MPSTTPRAETAMSTSLVTAQWNEPMEVAYERMREFKLRHLPVLNDQGTVVGMLSDRDVQRSMISEIRKEGSVTSESIAFDPAARVRDYMAWPVVAVEESTSLLVVAERMLTEKLSSFLVLSSGQVVGIVTTDDLLRVLVSLLQSPKTPAQWTLSELITPRSQSLLF